MRLINLFEDKVNTIGIIFGRFNPPHKGHRAAWEMASQNDVWFIGTNQSTVGPKDPLPFDVKVQAMTTVWPAAAGHIIEETSWLTMAAKMHREYNQNGDAVLLCYTDEEWVGKLINQYNGVEGKHGMYSFKQIRMVPTPRLSSATALRNAVLKGDRNAFSDAAGVPADTPVAGVDFFDLVAKYLLPYAETGKAKIEEGKISNYFTRMKDRNKYPLAKEFYRRTMDDPQYSNKSSEFIAAKIANMFGFSSPRDFVNYVTQSLNEDELSEINMSPGALRSFASSAAAKGIRIGFEAELVVPDLENPDNDDLEPNYDDYDEPVNTSSWRDLQNDLENFFSETESSDLINSIVVRVNEEIFDYMYNDFQQYLDSNMGQQELRDVLGRTLDSEEEIESAIEDQDRDYDDAVQEMQDDFYETWDDLSGALESLNLTNMSDWSRRYELAWPYWGSGGGDVSYDEFAERLADDLNIKIRTGTDYKSVKRDNINWIMEPDPSIEADEDGSAGVEIISPPMELEAGLEKMREFFEWMQSYGAGTNSSTGFHVGVSLPEQQMKTLDWLKVIVLLGDEYVLEKFNRQSNTYTNSSLLKVVSSIRTSKNENDVLTLFSQMKQDFNALSKKLMKEVVNQNKYVSVNIKDNYIEFRSMGGDYIDELDTVTNMIMRYAAVMSVAADPNAAKEEYAKKLYKLIDRSVRPEYASTVQIFSLLASGKMPKAAAKSFIRKIQQDREKKKSQPPMSELPLWNVFDYSGNVVHQVSASDQREATQRALNWARSNNQVISGIKRAKSKIANSNDDLVDIRDIYANEAIEPDEPGYQRNKF